MQEYTHRLTIYLDHNGANSTITTDINDPSISQAEIENAIASFYGKKMFRKTHIVLRGSPLITVPVAKILCCTVKPLV